MILDIFGGIEALWYVYRLEKPVLLGRLCPHIGIGPSNHEKLLGSRYMAVLGDLEGEITFAF